MGQYQSRQWKKLLFIKHLLYEVCYTLCALFNLTNTIEIDGIITYIYRQGHLSKRNKYLA